MYLRAFFPAVQFSQRRPFQRPARISVVFQPRQSLLRHLHQRYLPLGRCDIVQASGRRGIFQTAGGFLWYHHAVLPQLKSFVHYTEICPFHRKPTFHDFIRDIFCRSLWLIPRTRVQTSGCERHPGRRTFSGLPQTADTRDCHSLLNTSLLRVFQASADGVLKYPIRSGCICRRRLY